MVINTKNKPNPQFSELGFYNIDRTRIDDQTHPYSYNNHNFFKDYKKYIEYTNELL